ncbi:MAG: aldo/keto reductase [Gammaproteobacteria bacterium]|nr:aldo/keto reductase [Gammaproteobacteria bacterium]
MSDTKSHDKAFTRRDVLRAALAAGTAALTPAVFAAKAATPLKRTIPKSGEQIPAIGLGTWQTFDVGGSDAERTPLREVLKRFVALGGTVIDTSPMYGAAETVIGDLAAEAGVQQALFYATKVWTTGEQAGIRQMETSMRRMRVSRVDLMQVHNLVDLDTHMRTLRAWKEQGRIRYHGITHYTESAYDDLERALRTEKPDFVQLNYSLSSRQAERRLLPLAQELGIAVLVNRPFEKAGLFGRVQGKPLPAWAAEFDCASWAQFFLKFILAHPAVTCAIPATSKVKHLEDNMQAGLGRLPDAATRAKMAQLVGQL